MKQSCMQIQMQPDLFLPQLSPICPALRPACNLYADRNHEPRQSLPQHKIFHSAMLFRELVKV